MGSLFLLVILISLVPLLVVEVVMHYSGDERPPALLLLVGLAAVAAATIVSRRLAEPIYRLRDYAQAVARGEITGSVQASGPREVDDLVEAFNRMVRETQRREAEQKRLLEELASSTLRLQAEAAFRRETGEMHSFLSEATGVLSGSLDYSRTLKTIAELAVPRLADICLVDVIEGDSIRPGAACQVDGTMRSGIESLRTLYASEAGCSHPMWSVLRSGKPWIHEPEVEAAAAGRGDLDCADFANSLCALGVESGVVLPLLARGHPVGTVSLFSRSSGRRSSPESLLFLEQFVSRAAMAIDNARLYRDAREAIQARNEFLSVAAHELKTPMTSLRGFVQLARRRIARDGLKDLEQIDQALRVVDQQSRGLANLISQLLDVSRLEVGRLSLDRRVVDLGELVAGVVAVVLEGVVEHAIVQNLEPGVLGLVDAPRIEQVVNNLLDNAAKYSPPGSTIEVEVARVSADALEVVIADHGPGIPPEHRPHIFTKFYSGHPGNPSGGLGLGLYVSREIVHLHGGEIRADFPAQGGTRFVVSLPASLSTA